MDFDFSPEEQKFADQVEQWLVENHDPVVRWRVTATTLPTLCFSYTGGASKGR